ncbi:hypothetical protein BMS3Abin04_02542 [bacterium BMS3Abin04]|nr:hypothetical protein BMS3Abin04_02542 [bacterium BMS3Abin04]
MKNEDKLNVCISCNRDETIVPLVAITFAQQPTWICTQCLPTLIHEPQRLVEKFRSMDIDNTVDRQID